MGEKKPVLGAGREGLGTHPPQGKEQLEKPPLLLEGQVAIPQPTLPVELSLEPHNLVATLDQRRLDSHDLRPILPPKYKVLITRQSTEVCNCYYFRLVALFSHSVVSDSATPWTAAHQASLSFTISRSLFKFISIELVMLSNHLIFLI